MKKGDNVLVARSIDRKRHAAIFERHLTGRRSDFAMVKFMGSNIEVAVAVNDIYPIDCDGAQHATYDMVEHPAHYTSDPSGVECIQITQHRNFCIGNAIKYLWRTGLKNISGKSEIDAQVEDLEKAKKYIDFEIQRLRKL